MKIQLENNQYIEVSFNQSFYFSCIKETPNFRDEKHIGYHARQNPQFHYGTVSFEDFDRKASYDGWILRKIVSIPAALFCATVKTIYHLVLLILPGLAVAIGGNTAYLKAKWFYIRRDFQEAYGWLVTLFNDFRGQYLLQEVDFMKTCYDCFPFDKIPIDPTALKELGDEPPSEKDQRENRLLKNAFHDILIINEERPLELLQNIKDPEKKLETLLCLAETISEITVADRLLPSLSTIAEQYEVKQKNQLWEAFGRALLRKKKFKIAFRLISNLNNDYAKKSTCLAELIHSEFLADRFDLCRNSVELLLKETWTDHFLNTPETKYCAYALHVYTARLKDYLKNQADLLETQNPELFGLDSESMIDKIKEKTLSPQIIEEFKKQLTQFIQSDLQILGLEGTPGHGELRECYHRLEVNYLSNKPEKGDLELPLVFEQRKEEFEQSFFKIKEAYHHLKSIFGE